MLQLGTRRRILINVFLQFAKRMLCLVTLQNLVLLGFIPDARLTLETDCPHETFAWRLSDGFCAGDTPGVLGLLAGDDVPEPGLRMSGLSRYTRFSLSAHA